MKIRSAAPRAGRHVAIGVPEAADGTVSVRSRTGGDLGARTVEAEEFSRAHCRPKLISFDLDHPLVLLRLAGALLLLILVLAEIHDPADRRDRSRRNLDQVEPLLLGDGQRGGGGMIPSCCRSRRSRGFHEHECARWYERDRHVGANDRKRYSSSAYGLGSPA